MLESGVLGSEVPFPVAAPVVSSLPVVLGEGWENRLPRRSGMLSPLEVLVAPVEAPFFSLSASFLVSSVTVVVVSVTGSVVVGFSVEAVGVVVVVGGVAFAAVAPPALVAEALAPQAGFEVTGTASDFTEVSGVDVDETPFVLAGGTGGSFTVVGAGFAVEEVCLAGEDFTDSGCF